MTGPLAKLILLLTACAMLASADTVLFSLGGDPNQNYTFTRLDTPVAGSEYPDDTVTVPAGPYSGWPGQGISSDDAYFFCVTFTKTATFGATYSGTATTPTRQTQLEQAYLGAELYNLGATATVAIKGAISMAIWQIGDSAPGDVPVDPAAQPYVQAAMEAFTNGLLTSAEFTDTYFFIPTQTDIQTFMMESPSTAAPEPGAHILILTGLGLIALGRVRRNGRKRV